MLTSKTNGLTNVISKYNTYKNKKIIKYYWKLENQHCIQ